ncbi:MAG: hypothetical protein CFE21_14130 [Bacteroidetes bacterium B1(2017)]|nr:MAG: hypothetical protein CFE21_14130 [Bacteroidetes bacterium B1(2017)]
MKKLTIQVLALVLNLVLLSSYSKAQFVKGQKFATVFAGVNYSNTGNLDPFWALTDGPAIKKENLYITYNTRLAASIYKMKSDKLMKGNGFRIDYYGSRQNQKSLTEDNKLIEYATSKNYGVSAAYVNSSKWIFPIKPKFGANIELNKNVGLNFYEDKYIADTADGSQYSFNKSKQYSLSLGVYLSANVYYWISPRVILETGIGLGSLNVYFSERNFSSSSSANDNFNFSNEIILSLPFSSQHSMQYQYVSISYLLK